jgi:hypothetical protein
MSKTQSEEHTLTSTEYAPLTVGQTITIWPKVLFSADRDTEPGAQPWEATVVGYTDDKVIIASDYPEPGGFRAIDRECVR